MAMPEAELAPKAWAQQLANHLIECLQSELVSRVQQGVRDELRSFFSAQGTGTAAGVSESNSAACMGKPLLEGPPCLSAVKPPLEVPPLILSAMKPPLGVPLPLLSPVDLQVTEPNCDDNREIRRLSEPPPKRSNSEPDCGKQLGLTSLTNRSEKKTNDDDSDSEEEKEGDHVTRKATDPNMAAVAAAAASSAFNKRAQTANFESRFRRSSLTDGAEEDQSALFVRRHYRAFSTAREIKHFEKEKQAENVVHLLRDMSRSSSRILTPDPSDLQNDWSERPSISKKRGFMRCLIFLVTNAAFDYVVGLMIVLNAVAIGVQTDWIARHVGQNQSMPVVFSVIEWCFASFFLLELGARLLVYGRHFFTMSGRNWNIFDCVVVGLQLVEQLCLIIKLGSGSYNLSVFRMLRFLRLVRVIRLARVMRLIGELRTIVVSIMSSMRSLGWTVCLLLLMIYMVAVYLTQCVADWRDWRLEKGEGDQVRADGIMLQYYYGSVPRSVLSLYQSISGGLSWDEACNPLITYISPMAGVLFALYIAFAILAIMNVVTGVFVESALVTAKDDKDVVMLNNVREVFRLSDEDGDGMMSWDEFKQQLDTSELQELFASIGIDPKEAKALFQLLDLDGTGSISLAEFYDGCVRMKGEAKAIDLVTVMYESRQTSRKVIRHLRAIECGLKGLFEFLCENDMQRQTTG